MFLQNTDAAEHNIADASVLNLVQIDPYPYNTSFIIDLICWAHIPYVRTRKLHGYIIINSCVRTCTASRCVITGAWRHFQAQTGYDCAHSFFSTHTGDSSYTSHTTTDSCAARLTHSALRAAIVRAAGASLCSQASATASSLAIGDALTLHGHWLHCCRSLPFLRDLHSDLAAIAVIFCRNGSAALG
jgi:hypothetical protein